MNNNNSFLSNKKILLIAGLVILIVMVVLAAFMIPARIRSITHQRQTATVKMATDIVVRSVQETLAAESLKATLLAQQYATMTAMAPTATLTPTPAPTPQPGSIGVSPMDQEPLVYIPGGDFLMGSTEEDTKAQSQEKPQRQIYIDGYWIYQTEVTFGMMLRCIQGGLCVDIVHSADTNTKYGDPNYYDFPVVYVSWHDAKNYCQAMGGRLPTEAEWEKAARGSDGRIYPWGNDPPNPTLANFNDNVKDTVKVGSYPAGASPYGVLDMAGNVREWVGDWYDQNDYWDMPGINPQGPDEGEEKSLRGGSFRDDEGQLRAAIRFKHVPDSPGDVRGFRCVIPF